MTVIQRAPLVSPIRARNVTAVLGPTNTGKTHLAIERMLAHESGAIGLPLRLLAREVYGRIAARAGVDQVALVTGEEKIIPKGARYWVSTVEAMPRDLDVSFVAIDEIQLAADLERGHVFTDRILNVRGSGETMLLGSGTARSLIERLLPGIQITTRPRLSQLAYSGSKKITRLPRRSAIVAFSSEEVYAMAELIRRQRGGAAVVMGALSPRTRNAQVALFQEGDVDFLVATDAIGMGLNLDVEHVAFAQARKFDGFQYRDLTPQELGQIAGRAGRYLNDGTFGVTGRVLPLSDEIVKAIENHDFANVKTFQWRNPNLDFSSVTALRQSLDLSPGVDGLTRALPSDDLRALDYVMRDRALIEDARALTDVRLLWDVCQVPDFQKISPSYHGDIVVTLYRHLRSDGKLPDDWFARQVAFCARFEGDIDALSGRLAEIRTWTFVANRANWLSDPVHWQDQTRDIEDRLSDALHERLTQRFVDRRTSVLMKRLRENAMLEAEITATGAVLVESQHVGELHGFRFVPDHAASADGPDGKAVRAAAAKALAGEFDKRAERVSKAPNDDIILASDGTLRWLGQPIAKLVAGEDTLLPRVTLLADEQLTGPAREKVQGRLDIWIFAHITTLLKPLIEIKNATDLEGIARGLGFGLIEALGTLERQNVAEEVKALDQNARAVLRKYGVRFGAYHIYIPALLKPAPAALVAQLWALKHGAPDMPGLAELAQLSASGRTSIKVDPGFDRTLYRLAGFRVAGERAIRLDILERLADLIRPLVAWKPAEGAPPPEGAIPQGGGFTVTVAMTSLLGCSGEDFSSVLKALGYRMEKRTLRLPVKSAAKLAETQATSPIETQAGELPTNDVAADAPESPVAESPVAERLVTERLVTKSPAAENHVAETGEDISSQGDRQAAPAPVEAAAPPAYEEREVEVWRLARFDRSRRPDHRPRQGRASEGSREHRNRENHRAGQPAHPGKPRNEARGEQRPPRGPGQPPQNSRRDKPVDPNSPFAALLALKADLEQKGKK